ncbi:unnamed protein product [Paramecium sonneborni]|uniref:Cyclin N-terminal domain-containing protein n=1 Tax=Paramecium sonneborni TaxID=65129 RepID=A0A8S1QB74_9CILI|nr:unnamed protein product [Paramecium sonneborni]
MSQLEPFEHHYSKQYLEVFGCSHTNRHIYSEKMICTDCGIFLNNPNTKVYKTLKMKYNAFFNPIKVLQGMMVDGLPNGPIKQRQEFIEFILQVSERLNLSINTCFLAINYIDQYFNKVAVNENQTYLFVSTALMLAAKAQELDERVPFISKLKRYASMTNHPEISQFSTQDFKSAERSLIQQMEWKLQRNTLLDRIEALLSFGVIDDDDSLGQQQQKENKDSTHQQHIKLRDLQENQILQYVKEVESKYVEVALQIIRDEQLYFQTDQTILALSCVAYLRKKAGLLNIWSQQLQSLTGVGAQKISSSVSQIMTLIAKSKSFKTITKLQATPSDLYYQQISTPTNNTLTTVSSNHLINRQFQFEQKRQSFGDAIIQKAKIPLLQSKSTAHLGDLSKQHLSHNNVTFTTSNNYTFLNENTTTLALNNYISSHNIHPNHNGGELDKKYEQVHKVGGSLFRQFQ